MRNLLIIAALCFWIPSGAQTLGGLSVFNFLRFSPTPQLTAMGGVNVSQRQGDPGLSWHNPALLLPAHHTRMNAVFTRFYGGINIYHLTMGWHHQKLKTNFSGGLLYFDYGHTAQTDAAGNILGDFRPRDWCWQLSASRQYGEKWNYGASLKLIRSSYGIYRSTGLATDVGVTYIDTGHLFSAGVVVKNMGGQLTKYNGSLGEDLPFELQAGITKRLRGAPFSFSLTGQRLHRFDIRYDDTAFNNDNGYTNSSDAKFTAGKLLDHLILSASIFLGERVEIYTGYNFLRRRELNIGAGGNGLNGFSAGAGVLFGKMQLRYGRAYYQPGTALNQLGINLQLNRYFGLGKWGERSGW